MQTQLGVQIIGNVFNKLNQLQVNKELDALKNFPVIVPYPEDTVGLQRSYPLMKNTMSMFSKALNVI